MDQTLKKAFDKAKIGIMVKGSVFLSTVLFSLKQSFNSKIRSARTNGISLEVNPDWFMSLTPDQRIGLLAHEAWHVAFEHAIRRGERNPKRWNIAGDHLINIMLTDQGFILPPNGYCDYGFRDMSTQQIYDALPESSPMYEDFDCDIEEIDPNDTETELETSNIIIKAITQSQLAGESAGAVPEEISRKIQELINPVLPWQDLLQRFLSARSHNDFSWQRPNRRFMPDYHLPSAYSESLENIAIAVDTSGSVSDEQFVEFLSEIDYIHKTMKPKLMTVIDFDTRIKAIHEVTEDAAITDIDFQGYGGTDVAPVIDWAIENKPTVLLIFTDGEFSNNYDQSVPISLMWIIYGGRNFHSSIGEIVKYD